VNAPYKELVRYQIKLPCEAKLCHVLNAMKTLSLALPQDKFQMEASNAHGI